MIDDFDLDDGPPSVLERVTKAMIILASATIAIAGLHRIVAWWWS
jgi:hypothetical protein